MIAKRKDIEKERRNLGQLVSPLPILVRIHELFPEENAASIQLINEGNKIPSNQKGPIKFPFAMRSDKLEESSVQAGDLCELRFNGWQYTTGRLYPTYSEGSTRTMAYVPVRGSWAI